MPSSRARGSLVVAAVALAWPATATAAGWLELPTEIDGYPVNVGLLVLGHSTSAQGGYPAKLASALDQDAAGLDGRHYVAVSAVTGGDGGLLWSLLSIAPAELQYERVRASNGVGATPVPQWCEDAAGVRWSCRRAKLEEVLTGASPIPSSGSCADPTVASACRPAATLPCTWYDRSRPLDQNPVTESLAPHQCWARMDFRIALVQDTTNRSWPIDDFDADGDLDGAERWPANRVRPQALPCGGGAGTVGGFVDWNCDGALGPEDAARDLYAGWLAELAAALLATAGPGGVDHVFVGHKPVEMGGCNLYPEAERDACNADRHAVRTPGQIASTPDRPFDHYFLPTVYWEQASLEALFASPGLDARVRRATRDDGLAMWRRSEACYVDGLAAESWTVPASVPGRPDAVAADDTETDGPPSPDADAVGCMTADHVHHNEAGGWMMADVWYAGLAPWLFTGLFTDGLESGDASRWSATTP